MNAEELKMAIEEAHMKVSQTARECNELEDDLRWAEEEFANACEALSKLEGQQC